MKIAIIGHKRIPSNEGGIEKGVEQHALRMVARGHEVHVYNRGGKIRYGDGQSLPKMKNYEGIRIITIPTFSSSKLNAFVYSLLATLRAAFGGYDVVSYRASGPCAMIGLAKLLGMTCVASLHGIDSKRAKWGKFASWYLGKGEHMAATRADACMVLSSSMKQYIRDTYNTESILFYNGIDEPTLRSPRIIKERFSLEKDSYILYLSRIVPEKRLDLLVEAFKATATDKHLVIAGAADDERYREYLADLAGDDERIEFIGYATGELVDELYSNAYLFVLPSSLEGMSNSLLEAMSYGNCCLLSDIPENKEPAGDAAAYFHADDLESCKEALASLLADHDRVERLRAVAAERVLSRYSWDGAVDLTLGVYAEAAKKSKAGRR